MIPARLRPSFPSSSERGFTLIEMIIVTLLLMIAMLGLLAVFDASNRINKSESDVADAQGNVRYGIYQMTRVVRMAGTGGLYVTQAVLNHADSVLQGILPNGASYDNTAGVTVTDPNGTVYAVRPGTDMIEIRGVILSPLLGFDEQSGCNPCVGTMPLTVLPITGNAIIGEHLNNDPVQRPQFTTIDAYTNTLGASAARPLLVIVEDAKKELHTGCGAPPPALSSYPQLVYNVGVLNHVTNISGTNTFGNIIFGGTIGPRFNVELPSIGGAGQPANTINVVRRAGILDDIVFFVTTDPTGGDPNGIHPYLAQGYRRGQAFEVTRLADDVEDMQVAYGVDQDGDNAVGRSTTAGCAVSANDPDPNFSTVAGCDEWFPNALTEVPLPDAQFQAQDPFDASHGGMPPPVHCPRLHAVMISLLAKAHDPDPTYRGPAAQGYKLMNEPASLPVNTGNYRRRVQTLKINLRNYAFHG